MPLMLEVNRPLRMKSALTSKADIDLLHAHIRLVPLATDAPQQTASLFDHRIYERSNDGGTVRPNALARLFQTVRQ